MLLESDLQPWEKTWGDHAVIVPRRFHRFTSLPCSPGVNIVAVPSGNHHSVVALGGCPSLSFFANHATVLHRQNANLSFATVDVTLLRAIKRDEEIYVDYGCSHGKDLNASAAAAKARARIMRLIARVKRLTCSRCGNPYPRKYHFKHISECRANQE